MTHRLTRLLWGVVFALMFLLPSAALAVEIDLPILETPSNLQNIMGEYSTRLMLQHGNVIHMITEKAVEYTDEDGYGYFHHITVASCHELGSDGEWHTCERGCLSIMYDPEREEHEWISYHDLFITPEGETYFLSEQYELFLWTPDGEQCWTQVAALDVTGIEEAERNCRVECIVQDGCLYCDFTVINPDNAYGTTYCFRLDDGSRRKCFAHDDFCILTNGYDGKLVADTQMKGASRPGWFIVDTETGEYTLWINGFKDIPLFLVSDGQGAWYYWGMQSIYRIDAQAKEEKLCDMPQTNTATHFVVCGGYALCVVGMQKQSLYAMPLVNKQTDKVVCVGETGWRRVTDVFPDLFAFTTDEHLEVVYEEYPKTFDDIAQALVMSNDTFDVMIMTTSRMDVAQLFQKGFYTDLSDDPAIAAYVSGLYPVWRDEVEKDGVICALPVTAEDSYQTMRNADLWDELELGDVPQTYAELLDCIEMWYADGILKEYPLFEDIGADGAMAYLTRKLLNEYMALCERQNRALVFRDEKLLSLLGRLESLRSALNDMDALNIRGEPIFDGNGNVSNVTGKDKYPNNSFTPVSFAVDGEEQVVTAARVTVLMINPYSRRKEEAVRLLSYMAQNPSGSNVCILMADEPEGILQEGYEEWYAARQKEIELTRRLMESAREEGDMDGYALHEDQLNSLMDISDRAAWLISPEAAAMYYGIVPHLVPLHEDPCGLITTSGESAINGFIKGRIGAEEMTRRLDQILTMHRMENN